MNVTLGYVHVVLGKRRVWESYLLEVFSEAMYFHSCLQRVPAKPGEMAPDELLLLLVCLWRLSRGAFFCKAQGSCRAGFLSPSTSIYQPSIPAVAAHL